MHTHNTYVYAYEKIELFNETCMCNCFTNHVPQVFQVAPLFQIDGIIRSSYMQHVTPLLQNLQFGLYKRGPFTPLPFNKLQQYGELIASMVNLQLIQP